MSFYCALILYIQEIKNVGVSSAFSFLGSNTDMMY